ncbi:ABA4-like family protein [Sandarakinorhabdus sp.]|uniref:ABA4-like family protein n=1 Tax=Sandarakinorhabdus sp. TaxID=1916663 RepID=UPI00286E95BE|nr:ABA4-like family protein [Sandarakinorhabdus sp.]
MDFPLDPERLFSLASAFVLPGWLLLVLAPLNRRLCVLLARLVAATLAGLYVSLLVAGLAGEGPPAGAGFSTLEGVRLLLSSPQALLAGWVHYLVFDLFVGTWETENADAARVPHLALLPCLALTFVAGPTGLLLYLVIRAGWGRQIP